MSHWDGERIVRWEAEAIAEHPGWMAVDCGCCAGIKWGGETPDECDSCGGSGRVAWHPASGVLALWPGGPLAGRLPAGEAP